jgi:phosphatidylglycerophosphate synthase
MIDRYLLPLQEMLLRPAARALAALGVGADRLTLLGFAAGVAAALALALGREMAGLLLILVNRALDGLDGAVARIAGPTDRGAFLDIACDFVFYALVPLGFAFADPARNALPAAALIAAFVGTGSSFLAFAVIAAKRGLPADAYPAKGIYYLGGLAEGAETIAVFVAMCLWPALFPLFAWVFAAICLFTTLARWHMGWRSFAATPANRHENER